MRNIRCIVLLLFAFLSSNKIIAQMAVHDLVIRSKNYYSSLEKFSITVETKFKNAIIIDTILRKETHYIDNSNDIKSFKGKTNIFLRIGASEYVINYDNTFQELHNKRISAYKEEYVRLPFVEPAAFFNKIEGEIFLKGTKITESDSTFFLISSSQKYINKSIEFRKTNYSIRSITEIIYDQLNKGFQVEHIIFGPAHDLTTLEEDEINNMLALIKNPSNKVVFKKWEEEKPKFIDRSLLETNLNNIKNGDIGDIKKKIIVLDFFYQGCYPCLESHPYVNDFHRRKKPNLIVLGIDHLVRDSATIDRYCEKYNLQYPILIGEQAAVLATFFKVHGDPTFIIIAPDGKVIERKLGFTKGSFRRLTKSLTN